MDDNKILQELIKANSLAEKSVKIGEESISIVREMQRRSKKTLLYFTGLLVLLMLFPIGIKLINATSSTESYSDNYEQTATLYYIDSHINEGNLDSAISIARQVLKKSPRHEKAMWYMAYSFHLLGKNDSAKKYLNLSNSIFPTEEKGNLLSVLSN